MEIRIYTIEGSNVRNNLGVFSQTSICRYSLPLQIDADFPSSYGRPIPMIYQLNIATGPIHRWKTSV